MRKSDNPEIIFENIIASILLQIQVLVLAYYYNLKPKSYEKISFNYAWCCADLFFGKCTEIDCG